MGSLLKIILFANIFEKIQMNTSETRTYKMKQTAYSF